MFVYNIIVTVQVIACCIEGPEGFTVDACGSLYIITYICVLVIASNIKCSSLTPRRLKCFFQELQHKTL